MGLNIKNAETERLIRELASELNVSLTAAVTDAVAARLARVRQDQTAIDDEATRILEMWGELGRLLGPGLTSETFTDELYDERGLPR